eukprot:1002508-Prorocentrum_minimum.AAC.6
MVLWILGALRAPSPSSAWGRPVSYKRSDGVQSIVYIIDSVITDHRFRLKTAYSFAPPRVSLSTAHAPATEGPKTCPLVARNLKP